MIVRQEPLPPERTLTFLSIIVFAFLFGMLLLYISQIRANQHKQIFLLFGLMYSCLAALQYAVTSFFVALGIIVSGSDLLYYIVAILIVSGLAYLMGFLVRESKGVLSIPYIIATLLYIELLVLQIIWGVAMKPFYNIVMLVIAGVIIAAFSLRVRQLP